MKKTKNAKKIVALVIILLFFTQFISNGTLANSDTKHSQNCSVEKYYTYDEFTELLHQLDQTYPDIFNYSSLGKTWEGREIWLVKISDNVKIDEEETEVLFTGGMHGDEKQGYEVVIYTIKAFLENYTSPIVNQSYTEHVRNVINNTEIYLIPMLNPDGVVARTRKNARPNDCLFGKILFRGVDINRNSGYKWELYDKYPFRFRRSFPYLYEKVNVKFPIFDFHTLRGEGCYRGPYPFSEPESQALRYVVENNNISIYVDYHSASNHIMYGWGWNHELACPDEPLMLSIAQNISNLADYEIKHGSIIRYFGGMRDWMTAEHGVHAFSFELPKTIGDKRLIHWIHENGYLLPGDNIPIIDLCKMHVEVNLYFIERAMMLN